MIAPYFSVRRTEPSTIANFAQQLLQHNPHCLSEKRLSQVSIAAFDNGDYLT
jgi:hypothetical protein